MRYRADRRARVRSRELSLLGIPRATFGLPILSSAVPTPRRVFGSRSSSGSGSGGGSSSRSGGGSGGGRIAPNGSGDRQELVLRSSAAEVVTCKDAKDDGDIVCGAERRVVEVGEPNGERFVRRHDVDLKEHLIRAMAMPRSQLCAARY